LLYDEHSCSTARRSVHEAAWQSCHNGYGAG
jgi:hypothetical protein